MKSTDGHMTAWKAMQHARRWCSAYLEASWTGWHVCIYPLTLGRPTHQNQGHECLSMCLIAAHHATQPKEINEVVRYMETARYRICLLPERAHGNTCLLDSQLQAGIPAFVSLCLLQQPCSAIKLVPSRHRGSVMAGQCCQP